MSEFHVLGQESGTSPLVQVSYGDDSEKVMAEVKKRAHRFFRLYLIRPDFAVYELHYTKAYPAIEEKIEIVAPHPLLR